MSNMSKEIKRYIIDVLIWSGIFTLLLEIWKGLEIVFDGGVQASVSDSIVAAVIVTVIWKELRKWVEIKEN